MRLRAVQLNGRAAAGRWKPVGTHPMQSEHTNDSTEPAANLQTDQKLQGSLHLAAPEAAGETVVVILLLLHALSAHSSELPWK